MNAYQPRPVGSPCCSHNGNKYKPSLTRSVWPQRPSRAAHTREPRPCLSLVLDSTHRRPFRGYDFSTHYIVLHLLTGFVPFLPFVAEHRVTVETEAILARA